MTAGSPFSHSYFEARGRFLAAAESCSWACTSHPIAAGGPGGEALSIDVACSSASAAKILLLCSGLHGVEGYPGSAIQLSILNRIAAGGLTIPSGCRIVMVHALNPFGFAHDRRTDAGNVDLNRNFLLPGEAYQGSPPGYAAIDSLINPAGELSPFEFFQPSLIWKGLTLGFSAVKSAIACGQYNFPNGLFFGGNGRSEIFEIVQRELPAWIAPETDAAIMIDLHTGLGRHGDYILLTSSSTEELQANPLARGFSAREISSMASGTVAYPARGTLTAWVTHRQSARRFHAWGLEFGTYPGLRVLSALRAENRSRSSARAKAELREAFCPAGPEWRQRVIASATDVISRALKVLDLS